MALHLRASHKRLPKKAYSLALCILWKFLSALPFSLLAIFIYRNWRKTRIFGGNFHFQWFCFKLIIEKIVDKNNKIHRYCILHPLYRNASGVFSERGYQCVSCSPSWSAVLSRNIVKYEEYWIYKRIFLNRMGKRDHLLQYVSPYVDSGWLYSLVLVLG